MVSVPAVAPDKENVTSERLLLWTLLVVFTLNYLDRQIINILAEPIRRDLGLSDTQLGLLTGLAFALFYAGFGLPMARWADRPQSNRVGLISLSLVVWSGMTALCGQAQNFTQLLLARVGVGVGEAGCTPAGHSLISDMVPVERRSSAMAFYGLGSPAGSLIGMVLGGFLADTIGWRNALMVVGLPGLVLAAFVWLVLREPRNGAVAKATRAATLHMPPPPQKALWQTLKDLAGNRAYVLLVLSSCAVMFLGQGKATWQTIFFIRSHGLTPSETGLFWGLVSGLSGIFGMWAGGRCADRFGRNNPRHLLTAPALGMLVAPPLLFMAYSAADWRVALLLLAVPSALNVLWYGPTFALAQRLVPPGERATATAIMVFAQSLIGLGLGPLFFGMMSDAFKPMAGVESVRWVLYGVAWLGVIPAFLYWRTSLRLDAALSSMAQKGD